METKRLTQKFKVMRVFSAILGLGAMAVNPFSALFIAAGLGLLVLGVYLFVDDWGKVLAD